MLESLLYEFIPRPRFPIGIGFHAANTENLAFLPPARPRLAPINGKLIGGGRRAHYENFT
jgi:hypothetical protein